MESCGWGPGSPGSRGKAGPAPESKFRCRRLVMARRGLCLSPPPSHVYAAPTVCSTYCVWPGQTNEQSRCGPPCLPAVPFPAWGTQSGGGGQTGVSQAPPGRESWSPWTEASLLQRLPTATADQALASRWVGWAQKPSPQECRGGQRGRKGQAPDSAARPPHQCRLLHPGHLAGPVLGGLLSAPRLPLPQAAGGLCAAQHARLRPGAPGPPPPGPAGARGPQRGRAGG